MIVLKVSKSIVNFLFCHTYNCLNDTTHVTKKKKRHNS